MMANEQNLIKGNPKTQFSSGREAVENGKKGGLKSGEVRRKRKAMKEQMEMLLTLPLKNTKLKKQLQEIGINEKEIDNQMALIVSLYQTALRGGSNSVQAFSYIQELVEKKEENKTDLNSAKEILVKIKEVANNDTNN